MLDPDMILKPIGPGLGFQLTSFKPLRGLDTKTYKAMMSLRDRPDYLTEKSGSGPARRRLRRLREVV